MILHRKKEILKECQEAFYLARLSDMDVALKVKELNRILKSFLERLGSFSGATVNERHHYVIPTLTNDKNRCIKQNFNTEDITKCIDLPDLLNVNK